jgi:hypothetical protein
MTDHREKFDANHLLSHKFNKDESGLLKNILAGDKHNAIVKDAQEHHTEKDAGVRKERTALGVQNRELEELRKNFRDLLPEGTVIAGHAKLNHHDCLLVKPNKDSNDLYLVDPETNATRAHFKIEHAGGQSKWVQVSEGTPLPHDQGALKKGDVVSSYSDKGQVVHTANGHVREITYPAGSKNIRSLQFDEHGQPQKWTDGDGLQWTRQDAPKNGEALWSAPGQHSWRGKVTFNPKDNCVTEQEDGSNVQKTFNRNGSETEKSKDGSTITRNADGSGSIDYPKGGKNIQNVSFDGQGHASEFTDGRSVKWMRQGNSDANGENQWEASNGEKFKGAVSFNKYDDTVTMQAQNDVCKKTFQRDGSESNSFGDDGLVSIGVNGQIHEINYPNSKNIKEVKFDAHGHPNEWTDGENVKWTRNSEPDRQGHAIWTAPGHGDWKGSVTFNPKDNSVTSLESSTNIETACNIDGTKVVTNKSTKAVIRYDRNGKQETGVLVAGAVDVDDRHSGPHAGWDK